MEALDLTSLLKELADHDGSDLHLKAGAPPIIRVDGQLRRMRHRRVGLEDIERIATSILPLNRREQFVHRKEFDFAYTAPGIGRFRCNVFHQRGALSMVMRRVRVGTAALEEIGMPPVVRDLAEPSRGLVLVTGPTGAGKTTTIAAMIDHINNTKPVHIVTLEDPIEVLHLDRMATVNQREVGVDTDNYIDAMRAVVRQDPDVIVIGEMRDAETVSAAMSAAETGHLVLSTLHTLDAVETINRIIDFFPPWQHHQVRVMLASVLVGAVSQRLVPKIGGGRVPAVEVLVNNGRVADRIVDSERTPEILHIMAEGDFYGMQTFDQSLLGLVQKDQVTVLEALRHASNEHDFRLMLEQAGLLQVTG